MMNSRCVSRPSLRVDLSGTSTGLGNGWRGGNGLAAGGAVGSRTRVWGETGGAGAMAFTISRMARSSAWEGRERKAGFAEVGFNL